MERKKYELIIDDLSAIKYEEESQFDNSVSADAYHKAFSITRKILRENEKFRQLKNDNVTGNKLRNAEQIYNILFFTGAKGSGKTSTMLSYMEYLKDFYRKSDKRDNRLSSRKHLMFTGLEYIDASVMDKKEDILGCILSKMLKKWREEEQHSYDSQRMGIIQTNDYSYRKRNISMAFDRVYTNLKNLRSSKDVMEDEDDTFLETLEKLSLSWNLKESFQELVQKYLEIMKYPNTDDLKIENHFLIISIDEADMNIEHGFEIIEQIRQYLMGPNIIVLLSADYNQLEKICDNHFSREFSAINKFENIDKHIKKLTREYLEKVIPSDRRIFMPSGNEWKLLDREEIRVYYNKNNKDKNNKDEDEWDEKKDKEDKGELYGEGTIKQIVQRDCMEKLGIELYQDGDLIKYFVPNTLRELSAWIKKIKDFDNEKDMDKSLGFANVYEWFWGERFPVILKKEHADDAVFSMLSNLSPHEQIELMKNVLGYKNCEKSIFEIMSMLQIEDIEKRSMSNICILFLSMKIIEMMNNPTRKQKYLDYYSQWGLWGTWEQKMGFEYVITKAGKATLTCNIHCFNFSNLNGALEFHIGEIFEEFSKQGKLLQSEIDRIKNFQYMLLFFGLDKDIDEDVNPWEFDLKNQSIKLTNEYNSTWGGKGIFSFSNTILNIAKGCKLARLFCECIENQLKKSGISAQKANTKVKRLSIFSADDRNKMLMPLSNLEFLIRLGKKLEQEFSGKIMMELTPENVFLHLFKYCWIIAENLKKYDVIFGTEYEKLFSEFGVYEKILKKDPDFQGIFYETVQKVYVPKEIGFSD